MVELFSNIEITGRKVSMHIKLIFSGMSSIQKVSLWCFYRHYVILRLTCMQMLDDTKVTDEERAAATKTYEGMNVSVAYDQKERQRLAEMKQQKKEKKLAERLKVKNQCLWSIHSKRGKKNGEREKKH